MTAKLTPGAYRFYRHRVDPSWRLALPAEGPPPAGYAPQAWEFTLERSAADTGADVRRLCETRGYCLFRMGAAFEDIEAAANGGADPASR